MSTAVELKKPSFPVAAIRALRPRQWLKNGVVLVPLLFAKRLFDEALVFNALLALASFSLLASGVYVLNDWFDREKDRLHPEKRKRPIAAGHLGGAGAAGLVVLCWSAAAAIGWCLSLGYLGVLAAYLVLQFAYTFALKHMVLLDIMSIALGFILRVMAGAVAIDVAVSNWLFLCTLLGALFLGFAKRRAELSALEDASAHRASLADYTVPLLDQMMSICAACCLLAFGLYTVEHPASDRLKFTVPFAVYAVFRYLFLIHRRGAGGSPEKVLLSDKPLIVDTALFLLASAWALYA